jgi:hypothetical protein
VRSGAVVTLESAFADDASETYVFFDRVAGDLRDRREALSLSWFTTGGSFASDRTGRAEAETAPASANRWTAPVVSTVTTTYLWLVLRDSRGGVDFASYAVAVAP